MCRKCRRNQRVETLGHALTGAVVTDIRHACTTPDHKGLFCPPACGTATAISCHMSLAGLEGGARLRRPRIRQADTIILDVSGQRGDPFLLQRWMPATSSCPSCKPPGTVRILSVKPLLERMDALNASCPSRRRRGRITTLAAWKGRRPGDPR